MIKHIWSIFCRESKVEADTNNISIIDAYDSIEFDLKTSEEQDSSKPVMVPFSFEVVSLFYRDKKGEEETLDVSVSAIDPKGVKLGNFASKLEFKAEHNRMRNRVRFNQIALTSSGTYVFQIHTHTKDKLNLEAAIPVDVKVKINGKDL